METVTTDAAPNEVLATHIAAGKRNAEIEEDGARQPLLPNIRLVGRDQAHAFRRLMTRPYTCDDYLQETLGMFVDDNDSMAQKIQKSFVLRQIFAEEVAAEEQVGGWSLQIKNLRAAKHRFESLVTPLGRQLLCLPAFLRTCQRIAAIHTSDAGGKAAQVFLASLTAERLMAAAMLCDGLDECMILLRLVDEEDIGLSAKLLPARMEM